VTKTTYVVDHDTVERTVDRIYRRQLPKMEGSFYSSVKMTIASAEFQQLLSAVNDFGNAPDHMIQRVSFDLRPLAVCIRETAVMSSDEFLKLSSSINKGFTPDEHQFMMDLIKRGTTIAQELNNKTRNAIRAALKKALMSELTPPEVASLLTNTIGLDDRFATAVESFRQGLIARGVPKAQARKQSAQYASSLRHTRANTIARTETAKAIQAGQKHSYDQIVSNLGIPDAFVRIEWITAYDERTCANCAPMNGVQVAKNESFATPIGQSDGPPLHPNCRCTTTMRFTDPTAGVSKGDYPGHPFRGNQWTKLLPAGTKLIHMTHAGNVDSIKSSGMRPNTAGESGPGAYFTQTVPYKSTDRVRMDFETTRPLKMLDRSTPEGETEYRRLAGPRKQADGYDGVLYPGVGGKYPEVVIYDPSSESLRLIQ